MKVKELIEILQEYNSEMEVHFSYDYGDHRRTQVAPEVTDVTECAVAYSEYHQMDKLLREDSDFNGEEQRYVVVIG